MSVIIRDRLEAVKGIPLSVGCHPAPPDGQAPCAFCIEEKWAWMTGLDWTDHPKNKSNIISSFLRALQDNSDQDTRDKLDAWQIENADRLAATANDECEDTRVFLATDWVCRVVLPLWLEVAGATDAAISLRARPCVGDRPAARAVREAISVIQRDLNLSSWIILREDLQRRVREAVTTALREKKGPVGAAGAAGAAWVVGAAGAAVAAWVAWVVGPAEAAWAAEAAGAAWVVGAAEAAWAAEVAWAAEAAPQMREAARAKILEIWGEQFAPTTTEIKRSAIELLDRMVNVGEA